MKVVVGLGNPDRAYEDTWHNMGFWVIDKLSERLGAGKPKKECEANVVHIITDRGKLLLVKPLTYMNLSGDTVYLLAKKYKLDISDFLVVADDIDIPRGEIRYRQKGSGGTHNGLKNIVAVMGSENFARLKVGIGRGNPLVPLNAYVLRKLSKIEITEMTPAIDEAVERILDLVSRDSWQ